MSPRVVVVGGGLAGITAALECSAAGFDVTLLEAKGRLGGLTHSFRRGDLDVDNGQHVFLRCCTSYVDLLRRLGVSDKVYLQPRLDIEVRSPTAPPVSLRGNGLPAPLHLADSVLRYRHLPLSDRLKFGAAAFALRRVDASSAGADGESFANWLGRHGQSERAITKLWDLVGIATLNAPATGASLALAATVFQIGLLTDANAADIGWSKVPLRDLHGEPAKARLTEAGAQVLLGTKVNGLERDGSSWRVLAGETALTADRVVLAAPPEVTERLLPPGAVDLRAGWSRRLGYSPILNAHAVFDRRVTEKEFFATVDSPLQWVFDRTEQSGVDGGQYLAVSLSAADDLAGKPVRELRELVLPELRRVLPAARHARVLDFFVTREKQATFRPAPGSAALRPGAVTAADGLVLAGAWTATGWPATMEGAVRSGEAAARATAGAAARVLTDRDRRTSAESEDYR